MCAPATLIVNHVPTLTFGPVVILQVMGITGALNSVEDLLQLFTGQTLHAVLRSCINTGQRVLSTILCCIFLRLSCFPITPEGTTSSAVFMSLWLCLQHAHTQRKTRYTCIQKVEVKSKANKMDGACYLPLLQLWHCPLCYFHLFWRLSEWCSSPQCWRYWQLLQPCSCCLCASLSGDGLEAPLALPPHRRAVWD